VQAFPTAQLYGPGGLRRKRPDLSNLIALPPTPIPDWADDFDQLLFDGFPAGAETVWFHKASRTLILTDICQWWQGELPLLARFYAMLTGVRDALAVPRTVRWLVKDKAAARRSATRILQWPIERVVVAHNSVIERDAMAQLRRALGSFVD
jgi:hypothetical protein